MCRYLGQCPAEVGGSWHPWDVLRSLYLCDSSELGLCPQHSVSTTWQLSVSAGQNQNIQFWRHFWAAKKREGKEIHLYIYVCVWIKPVYFLLTFWCDFGASSFSPNQNTHFNLSALLLVWEGLFGIAVCTAENQPWLPWLRAKQWLIKISCLSRHSVDNNPGHSKGNVFKCCLDPNVWGGWQGMTSCVNKDVSIYQGIVLPL